jgi:DNA-binding transcriptional regulator YhcF (GntR family)
MQLAEERSTVNQRLIPYDLLADIALTFIPNPIAKIVLLELARYSNSVGECFPSRETISNGSGIAVRSVVRAIQWLENEGLIRIEHRYGTSNFYVITSMEEEMTDDTRANLAHEGVIYLDQSKKKKDNTSYRANLARPMDSPLFLAFWQAYPRRIGKGAARTAFARSLGFADGNKIVQAAIAYAAHCTEAKIEQKFIPHPTTWLNAERWEDDLATEESKPASGWGNVFNEL